MDNKHQKPVHRIEMKNLQRWGQLVKTWATGHNHIGDAHKYPVPKTLEEFKTQLKNAGCGATIPDTYRELEIIHTDLEKLVIRLPPKVMIELAEHDIAEGKDAYPLPEFYSDLAFDKAEPEIEAKDRLTFNDYRIGEYTINNCR